MAGFDPQDELPAKLPGIRMRLGSIVDGASEANCKTDTKVSSTSAYTVAHASCRSDRRERTRNGERTQPRRRCASRIGVDCAA